METVKPEEVDQLFDGAAALEPEEQERFLEEACRGRPRLRRRLEELLAADRRAEGFLQRPLARLELSPGESTGAGEERTGNGQPREIGPYRILRLLGQGGMGQVYLAERREEGFQRLVALKVIRAGFDSPTMRARFLRERLALARLEHPGIARLYDGDTPEDGPPYLVMERIQGEPIDVYCRQRRLSVEERIRLFLKVCDAVAYAHRNLVVHRDVKPSNVLVTEEGRPLLLDFGIAKLLQEDNAATATRTEQRPMSLRFASPEQVRGDDVGTATDVYSLGVLLYLLVTGGSPYRRQADHSGDLERAILERPPIKPRDASAPDPSEDPILAGGSRRGLQRGLRRGLANDLDVILLQCLRKEPEERYESVAALAEDLRRALEDRPIRARPEPWTARAYKFWRRHRLASAAALLIAALTVAFLAALAVQNQRIRRQRDLAEEERTKAATTLNLMTELLQEPDPGGDLPHRSTARSVLERSSPAGPVENEPSLEAARLAAIGRAYASLEEWEKAAEAARRALEIRRQLYGEDNLVTAESLHDLGHATARLGRREAAEPLLRRALEIRRRELPEESEALASTRSALGFLLYQEARPEEAKPLLQEALRGLLGLYGPDHLQVAEVRQRLGNLLLREGAARAAEEEFEEAYAIHRRALGVDHPLAQESLDDLAVTRLARGDFAGAADSYRALLASLERSTGPDHDRTRTVQGSLARALLKMGSFEEAEALTRETLDSLRREESERWDYRLALVAQLGRIDLARGRPVAAEEHFREALRMARERLGPQSWTVAVRLLELGEALRRQGRPAEAKQSWEEARGLLLSLPGATSLSVLQIDRLLARLVIEEGRLGEAESFFRRIRSDAREAGASALRAALDDAALAHLHLLQGELSAAEPLIREALRQLTTEHHEEDPRRAWVELVGLALQARQGEDPGAVPEMEERVRRLRSVLGPRAFETRQGEALVETALAVGSRAAGRPQGPGVPAPG